MISGSVGRGTDDRWSDVEVDVYYDRPPTEAERIAAAEASGGMLVGLTADDVEWEEQLSFDGFHAHTSTFLVATMERYLGAVVDSYSVDGMAQSRVFSVLNGMPVKGREDVDRWRARATPYPEELRRAMLAEHLRFDRFRYMARMLTERDDVLLLNDLFVEVGGRLICALLGLNGIYLPTPAYTRRRVKSMDETIDLMAVKPAGLSPRLKQVFRGPPAEGLTALEELIDETLVVIERHAPGFDTGPCRASPPEARRPWDEPPRL
jgi:hypothetical protein